MPTFLIYLRVADCENVSALRWPSSRDWLLDVQQSGSAEVREKVRR